MRSFKRAVLVTLSVLVLFCALSALVFAGYFHTTERSYQSWPACKALAGTLDTLFCGSSQGKNALIPARYDAATGSESYNLGTAMISMRDRRELLARELDRNPVRTVYLELSYESLSRDEAAEGIEGRIYALGAQETFFQRLRYVFTRFGVGDWRALYSDTFAKGIRGWKAILSGSRRPVPYEDTRGYEALPSADLSAAAPEPMEPVSTAQRPENLSELRAIAALCRERGVRLVLVTVPISPTRIWRVPELDTIRAQLQAFADENGLEYYDYNLYRAADYSARDCFANEQHMSGAGAERFMADFLAVEAGLAAGEDVRPLFYESYAALREARGAD